jgi:KDO II ethanolaminephosphotransferase
MFVREGGASDNPQRTLKEQNVFSVLHQLGFTSDLYAMQSEMWFYSNTMAHNMPTASRLAQSRATVARASMTCC